MKGGRPDLVIFDCDGVIVDSEEIGHRVVIASLARHGVDMDGAEVQELFVGGTILGTFAALRARGVELPDDWVDSVYSEMFEALARVEAIPGVAAVLDALEAVGLPYCIGSNGPQSKMDVTLGATGLAERFAGRRFSAREVAQPKPAPDLFLFAAGRMGVAPARCVVVGDTPTDAKAARAAGMPCFGYAAKQTSPETFRRFGATPFDDMAELPALLRLA